MTAAPTTTQSAPPTAPTAICYRLSRPDASEEWQAYHAIRQGVLLEARERSFEHPETDEERQDGHFPLLLWVDDRPVGTVRVDRLAGQLAALRLVAIDVGCQGRGHGLRLLHEAETFARGLGCRAAVVYATREAAGFYERCGYVEEDWDDRCIGGIVQMIRPLL